MARQITYAVVRIIVQGDSALSDTEMEALCDRLTDDLDIAARAVVDNLKEKYPTLTVHAE